MSQIVKSVCVYCGASSGASSTFLKIATDVGRALGEHRIRLIYGGGGIGLMGAVADAVLAAGGDVVGIIPKHLQQAELGHRGLTELKIVDTMHTRKRMMFDLSEAFIVLPGGMGTLDETFEIITWRQLGMHDKPIILLNHEQYWDPFLGLVDHVIGNGFARPAARQLFSVASSIGRLFDLLEADQTREPSYPERI
ncbi:MAG TPA: TIGR00730 family Rossman fold protein [Dongiaceae bacterium]|nr:TIGR00730 family Rossman fold protein [Dongiaceae bacterium]